MTMKTDVHFLKFINENMQNSELTIKTFVYITQYLTCLKHKLTYSSQAYDSCDQFF